MLSLPDSGHGNMVSGCLDSQILKVWRNGLECARPVAADPTRGALGR